MQRTLVSEAQIYKEREARKIYDPKAEEKKQLDVETQRRYEQFYSLGEQKWAEGAQSTSVNASGISPNWGAS